VIASDEELQAKMEQRQQQQQQQQQMDQAAQMAAIGKDAAGAMAQVGPGG